MITYWGRAFLAEGAAIVKPWRWGSQLCVPGTWWWGQCGTTRVGKGKGWGQKDNGANCQRPWEHGKRLTLTSRWDGDPKHGFEQRGGWHQLPIVFIGPSGFMRRKGGSRKLFWQFRQEMEEVWTKVEAIDILRSESLYVFREKRHIIC